MKYSALNIGGILLGLAGSVTYSAVSYLESSASAARSAMVSKAGANSFDSPCYCHVAYTDEAQIASQLNSYQWAPKLTQVKAFYPWLQNDDSAGSPLLPQKLAEHTVDGSNGSNGRQETISAYRQ